MRDISPGRLALYLGLAATVFSAVVVAFLPLQLSYAIFLVVLFGFFCYLLTYFTISGTIYKRIDQLNEQITASIKNETFKRRIAKLNTDALDKLDNAVAQLIREKTIEIDNLKDLERLRKEFLGDVAHELRSPIFNIQGYIDTLVEGALEDEEVSRKFLGKAAKHVDHLSSLVEDLVTISRIEAGELQLDLSSFDIKELIREVMELLDLSAKQKGISITSHFVNEDPVIVSADRQKIRQVLMNLVSNSIKYGRDHGHTAITLVEAHTLVTIEVKDDGEGIAEEHLPRIFERFYRVDKARARTTQPSTGLGLAIVKHFIEAHKQKILVTSREGIGSIFSFNLEKAEDS
jgi:two-component system phosphate regulon sensor histidine kinase PhoR